MSIKGIDVSNNNGKIDWLATSKTGIDFAICKITEGATFFDEYFTENWVSLENYNIIRGAYHFASLEDPTAEAKYFCGKLKLIGGLNPGDFLVLDIEEGNGDLTQWALTWLQTVQNTLGVKPWIYSYLSFFDEHFYNPSKLSNYPIWVA